MDDAVAGNSLQILDAIVWISWADLIKQITRLRFVFDQPENPRRRGLDFRIVDIINLTVC